MAILAMALLRLDRTGRMPVQPSPQGPQRRGLKNVELQRPENVETLGTGTMPVPRGRLAVFKIRQPLRRTRARVKLRRS